MKKIMNKQFLIGFVVGGLVALSLVAGGMALTYVKQNIAEAKEEQELKKFIG